MSLAREIREMIYELFMLSGGETSSEKDRYASRVSKHALGIDPVARHSWVHYSGSAPRLALKSRASPLKASSFVDINAWWLRNMQALKSKRGLLDYYDRDQNGQLQYRNVLYLVYALAVFEGRVLNEKGQWLSTREDRKCFGALQDFLQFFWSKTVLDMHQVWWGSKTQIENNVRIV